MPEKARASRRNERLAWLSALGVVAAIAGALWRQGTAPSTPPAAEMRVEITTPPTTDPSSLAISPSGQTLAFVATSDGQPRLWMRAFDSVSARVLPGTDDATAPFWSPDSRSVAFFADGRLKRIDLDGGLPRTLASAPSPVGGTWGRDGIILFSMLGNPIFRVSDAGGDPVAVTRLDARQGAHYFPQWLPDGRHFLYWAVSGREPNGVFVAQLDQSETHRLLDADFGAVYAPQGYLLFVRQRTLFAQRFDPTGLTLSGSPFPVAEQITNSRSRISPAVSTSVSGAIAYRTGSPVGAQTQLTWFDRSGRELGKVGAPFDASQLSPSLSPDGRRVALFRLVNGNVDIWLLDVVRGVPTRFTFDSADDVTPLWSPDGGRIVFSSNRKGVHDLYVKPTAGPGSDEALLVQSDQNKAVTDWSSDGRFLLYQSVDPKRSFDILAQPLARDGTPDGQPFPVVQSEFEEHGGQFSPDGKWVAYVSIKSDRYEVYVRPFAQSAGSETRISTDGGDQVRWRPDGKELYKQDHGGSWRSCSPVPDPLKGNAGGPNSVRGIVGRPTLPDQHPHRRRRHLADHGNSELEAEVRLVMGSLTASARLGFQGEEPRRTDRSGRGGPVPTTGSISRDRPPTERAGSVCTCEQLTGTSARYACSEEHDHECKPSPHRHPSASTSGEETEQAACADCGSTAERTGCARSKGPANVFTIPLADERETPSSGLARERSVDS